MKDFAMNLTGREYNDIDNMKDPVVNDIAVVNYDFMLVDGIDQIRQKIKIRLQFFLGEWFLDTSIGVPFWNEVHLKNPNKVKVDAALKATILDTPGVNSLTAYDSTFDVASRTLTVNFTVDTIYGELTISEAL
jgi:hypothetical protein